MKSERPNTLTDWLGSYFSSTWNPFFSSIGFCACILVCIKVGISPSGWSEIIVSENGPVERMSAAIWFMGFVWCLFAAFSYRVQAVEWLSIAMFLLLFGLRELDAHIWSTQWNLDKLSNYWNPRFPLTERLLVLGFLVVPCMGVGVMLVLRMWNIMGQAWRGGELWISHLLLGVTLLILCITLDKVGPYVLPILGVDDSGQIALMSIEEFLELLLAVFTMASLWPFLQAALDGHE